MAKVRRATHAGSWYTGNGNSSSPSACQLLVYWFHCLEISSPSYSQSNLMLQSEGLWNLLSYPCLSGIKPCQFSGEEHNIKLLAETIIGRLKATAAVIRANIHTLYSYGTVTITLTFYDVFERWIHHSSLQADMMMGVIWGWCLGDLDSL